MGSENTFDVVNVFDSVEGEEDPKPLSRIEKIRKSIRTLKRKKKKGSDSQAVDEELDGNNDEKLNFDTNEEDNIDERIDDFSDKDEIDEVVLDKKKKKKGSGKWDHDEETKIKIHSRSNSKHENIKLETGNNSNSSGWSDNIMETSGQ